MSKFTNADQLAAGLSTLFMQEFNKYNNESADVAMFNRLFYNYKNIKNKTTNFGMLGNVPKMRKWLGGREAGDINKYSYNVTQEKYEGTLRFDRDDVELYDEYGQVNAKITELAQEASQHVIRMGTEFIEGTFANLCYDGQYMVDDDHSEGESGTQDNKGTAALSTTTFGVASAAMMAFKDDKGRVVPKNPDLLVVPPALRETAFHLMNNDFYPDSSTTPSNKNMWKGAADVWVNPYLTVSSADWWLTSTNGGLPPFFIAMARDYEFTALTDENARHDGVFEYGVQASFVMGNADWRKIYGSDVT